MSEQKEPRKDEENEEELSIFLRQLYRLTYETIENNESGQILPDKYTEIIKKHHNIMKVNSIPNSAKSAKELIAISEKVLSSSNNELIYGKKEAVKTKENNDPKLLLLNYCSNDNIDQSIVLLLKYKLNDANASCLELCHYIQKSSGWAYCNETAVHCVMENINKSEWSYNRNAIIQQIFPNEEDKDEKKKYVANIIANKYKRRLLLFEIFLREKTSTSKVMYASGGYHTQIRNDSILQMALSMNNMDVYSLIFEYGVDVNIDKECTTNNSSNKSSSYSIWKPIHKAVENRNYELVRLLIANGANIKDYKTDFYLDDYNISKRDRQETLFYLAAKLNDNNKMFKLILNTSKADINGGLPDVDKINMFIVTEAKPKDVYDAELADIKTRIKADRTTRGAAEEEYDEQWGPWTNRRSPYFLRSSEHVYHYETLLHFAVRECNIEMVKLLLIYGADTDNLYKIKTMQRNTFHQRYGGRGRHEYTEKERAKLMNAFHDSFVEKYKNSNELGMYEFVLSVYQILENAKCDDDKIKNEIKKMLQCGTRWFPEMQAFYPDNMGKLLYIVNDVWCKQIPKEVTALIINYFYTLFNQ